MTTTPTTTSPLARVALILIGVLLVVLLLLATEGALMVRPVRLLDCIGILECEVRDRRPVGDHLFFTAEVTYAAAEPDRFDKRWRPDAYTLQYLGGRTYMSNGKIYVPNRLPPGR